MKENKNYEVWFITGSQHLYGDKTLKQVDVDSGKIVDSLNNQKTIPFSIKFRPVVTDPGMITKVCREANSDENCIGLIMWMHTFSPSKMWIKGLSELQKPFVHLHTQFGRDIPWDSIDMDFMNLNQSAHGGREFGFMVSRLGINRTVLTGHFEDPAIVEKLSNWMRVAAAHNSTKNMKVARFGDNMREVAVTEGDKVEAQIKFGYSVSGYGMGDLTKLLSDVSEGDVLKLIQEYEDSYTMGKELLGGGSLRQSIIDAARIELAMKSFLEDGGFSAFTTTFENLYGLKQLPGLACQRLMNQGYGFGAEGDWKTAALTRTMKVMGQGLSGGTSFMEDYTYHFEPGNMKVLGSHMLEVCPSIASGKPSLELHPLGIGGKDDPARLVFTGKPGHAINVTVLDMGNRFRMLVNEVNAITPEADLPKLPVARVLWEAKPDLQTAATAWIYGGGAHHTVYSQAVTTEIIEMYADMADIEFMVIDKDTKIRDFRNTLRWNAETYGN
ncbi:MAG: L-arabinose isomerase [Spirochaetaceae bacterium]|jgi:L-arabinose isomerase|nr:L-arabinose isomerase [Spirochaetaceae bacterium]